MATTGYSSVDQINEMRKQEQMLVSLLFRCMAVESMYREDKYNEACVENDAILRELCGSTLAPANHVTSYIAGLWEAVRSLCEDRHGVNAFNIAYEAVSYRYRSVDDILAESRAEEKEDSYW